jgi:hypothetical protein
MYLQKHWHCFHAQLEDAPEVLGHASISKLAVRATTERQKSWSGGGYLQIGGKKSTKEFNTFYVGIQWRGPQLS